MLLSVVRVCVSGLFASRCSRCVETLLYSDTFNGWTHFCGFPASRMEAPLSHTIHHSLSLCLSHYPSLSPLFSTGWNLYFCFSCKASLNKAEISRKELEQKPKYFNEQQSGLFVGIQDNSFLVALSCEPPNLAFVSFTVKRLIYVL